MISDNWKGYLTAGILIITVVFWISFGVSAGKVLIHFTPEVEISTERMYLGHIARIEGNSSQIEELKLVDLGPSPLPGGSFSLARELVTSVLIYKGFDLNTIEFVDLEMRGITVRRAFQLLDAELVRQEVYSYIYDQFLDYDSEIVIEFRRNLPEIKLPLGFYSLQLGSTHSGKSLGSFTLPVEIIIDGKVHTRVPVSLDVKLYTSVFVPTKTIDRLSLITSAMVEKRRMEITQLSGELVTSLEDLVGKQANRTIREHMIIVKEYLIEPILIKRNDLVTIVVRYGGVRVEASGKALDSGAKGDLIWVENTSSGKKVRAQVVDVGVAQVLVD